MGHISVELRHRVLFEYQRSKNISKVAKLLHVNRKTVQRWVHCHNTVHSLTTKKGRGRKAALDADAASTSVSLLLSGEYSGCKEVAKELQQLGKSRGPIPVHRTTVLRHAKAFAAASGEPIRAVSRRPAKQLTHDTMAKRLAFCQSNRTRNWGHVMFTDRKRFLFQYPGSSVKKVSWLKKGQQRVAAKVNHAMCVNMYAGITLYGVTKPCFVAGTSKMVSAFTNKKGQPSKNITSNEYKHVLVDVLMPEGKRIFSAQGLSNWVLQQDNDPTHKKAAVAALQDWKATQPGCVVTLLPNWPPNSPDLSPIENVWAYVQGTVDAAGCKTFENFQATVMQTFQQLPHKMLGNLYRSMKDRVAQCIGLSGGKTKY